MLQITMKHHAAMHLLLLPMIMYRIENLNPLSHPNAILALQASKVSGENLNYVTLALSKAKW